MGTITRGLKSIEFAPLVSDGGPGTVFSSWGLSDRDSSVTHVEGDPTLDRLYSHESDTALDVQVTGGEMPFLVTVVDPDLATFAKAFGGTVTGTGATATYSFPSAKYIQDLTVKITPKKGLIETINRGSVYAKLNADYAKAGKVAIDIVVEPLLPEKTGVGPVTFGPMAT